MFLPSVARCTPPPQPVAVTTSVGFAPHTPATQTAPASHCMPHMPQLSGSVILTVHTAAASVPQVSGLSAEQSQTCVVVLHLKPVPSHSGVFVQAPPGFTVPVLPPAMPPEPLAPP